MSESETASTTPATTTPTTGAAGTSSASTEPMAVPMLPEDWDRQATERVIDLVDKVKIQTSGRAIVIARAAVYGFLLAIFGLVLLVAFLILLIRIGANIAPVWLVYLVLGGLFSLIGALLWRKRPKGALT